MKGENDLKGFHLNSVQLVLFLLLMASMQNMQNPKQRELYIVS